MDDTELRERIAAAARRSFYPAGTVRQMAAIAADSQRAHALGALRVPTLVIHGKADPLVPYACGEDTARRIPGATLIGIEGMGHDLPAGVVQRILEPLIPHLNTSEAAQATT
jgi:pimeloyl-ACP methyl ester carboxylesterase